MKELGAIKNSGAEDQSANAKKNESGVNSGTAITITDEENGRQMKANENVRADLPRIRKAITRSKSQGEYETVLDKTFVPAVASTIEQLQLNTC